jgi:hypothetical protein
MRAAESAPSMAVEAFGVPIEVTVSDTGLVSAVEAVLPPGCTPCDPQAVAARFSLRHEHNGALDVALNGQTIARTVEVDLAIGALDAQIRAFISANAREWIFVHAGAVAYRGRALLIPGPSLSGKTTLVAALLRAGATYYSDEFAVLGDDGQVHPYPKSLSLRLTEPGRSRETSAEELGGPTGDRAIPVGLIAITRYRPGATWNPEPRTAGVGALALLANTGPARARPEQALHAVTRAAGAAIILESDRGEAEPTAGPLLAALA